MKSARRKLTLVVHDTRTVPYSAWGRKARREGGGLYSHARGTSPDRGRSTSHSLLRSVLEHALHFFEDGITRLSPHSLSGGRTRPDPCKKKEHTLLCALSFWNRHRHTLPGPRRFRLIRRRRTSLAAPADTARAPFPLALWRAIVSSSTSPLPFARRLSARGWGQDTARSVQKERAHIVVCSSFLEPASSYSPGPCPAKYHLR